MNTNIEFILIMIWGTITIGLYFITRHLEDIEDILKNKQNEN